MKTVLDTAQQQSRQHGKLLEQLKKMPVGQSKVTSGVTPAITTKSAICEYDSVALAKIPATATDLSENKIFM